MARLSFFRVLSALSILVMQPTSYAVDEGIRKSLVQFMEKIAVQREPSWGWNMSSDPCSASWKGVVCSSSSQTVKKVVLQGMNLSGILDPDPLCSVHSIAVLSLNNNSMSGVIPQGIANCKHLTHLYLRSNRFSGNLPKSLSRLSNLKRLDISDNDFNGDLPDLARISGMVSFLAQDNHLEGRLPALDLSNFEEFNVSNNELTGPIPDVHGLFGEDSFSGNPGLCGAPLQSVCPPAKNKSRTRFLIYSGYILLGLIIVLLVAFKLFCKTSWREDILKDVKPATSSEDKSSSSSSNNKSSHTSNSSRINTQGSRSEYSITSAESGSASSSLIVLNKRMLNQELRFEDLLRAPAELLRRGKHGSLYKVTLGNGLILAVKRMSEWSITKEEFKSRMEKMDRVKHPNIMSPVAFYCSKEEKLLVFEYQPNGSLFNILHGTQGGQTLDWGSRLGIAASIADTLAFMHTSLVVDQIAHGNLKSTNILFDPDMELYVSEYGLMVVDNQRVGGSSDPFHVDIFAFGVILLELLTGKMVQNNGYDLATWVKSAVREEWTVEVFDPALTSDGLSEERMVNLLQIALKCIYPSPEAEGRPSMRQVAAMVNKIKQDEDEDEDEDEERCLSSSEAG